MQPDTYLDWNHSLPDSTAQFLICKMMLLKYIAGFKGHLSNYKATSTKML